MVQALTKEVSIIKRKLNSVKDDEWCENNGSYYSDKLYKIKYYCGVTEIDYGSNINWQTFESAQDSEYYEHDNKDSGEPFISTIKNNNFVEYYQLAELNINRSLEKKLDSIIDLIRGIK